MVTAYFDTGVLVKMYAEEANSDLAIDLIRDAALPLPFTHLHRIELFNAIRLKAFRKEITPGDQKRSLRLVATDIQAGRLQLPSYDLAQAFRRAEALTAKYTSTLGVRSLDVMHVAFALEAECTAFCSFDRRQRLLAQKTCLHVVPRHIPL